MWSVWAGPGVRRRCVLGVVLATTSLACTTGVVRKGPSSPAADAVPTMRTVADLPWLEDLYDDAKAAGVSSAQSPGVVVSGAGGRTQLVARFAAWEQGGDAPNPPPLTAVRIVTLEGLEPEQISALVSLATSTTQFVEQQYRGGLPSTTIARLKSDIDRAAHVAHDRRARPDCRTPCQPWRWQTVWSVLTTAAHAQWRLGARLKDVKLLQQAAELAQRAASAVPEQSHPLTAAVSHRLVGAVLDRIGDLNDDVAVLDQSLAATERALAGFRGDRQRVDWALTQGNLQKTLSNRAEQTPSAAALGDALAASERALAGLDQGSPNLRADALLERARLLQNRAARSGETRDLDEALRLVRQAASTQGANAESLVAAVTLARCELESEIASSKDDVQGLEQAVTLGEQLLRRPTLPESMAPEAHRIYGLALGRLAIELDDAARVAQAVEQLERAIEGADRLEGKRATLKLQADYAWGLIQLGRLTSSIEAARKATVVVDKALEPISKHKSPWHWAQMKQLQGSALMSLAVKARGAFQLEQAGELYARARTAFSDALGGFPKEENRKRWAGLQQRIGATLAWQGEIAGRQQRALLGQSVATYEQVLKGLERHDDPEGFARAQLGLGSTYLIWADQTRSRTAVRDPAERAAAAFRLAVEAFQQAGQVKLAAHAKAHLADALDELRRVPRGNVCDAVALRLEAVAAHPQARGLWSSAQESLQRLARVQIDPKSCTQVPATFWQPAPTPGKKP